ncbi:MAG: type II secretion system protein [Thermodesulfobacteriota bacterium]|nr:type II secretion system protein [Thermodesulfobacteriota bacterium]
MRTKSDSENKRGFTLVELAVVLVIIGVMISAMASVLPTLRVWKEITWLFRFRTASHL